MTRLTYLTEAAIPSPSSNATATVRMCGAFAEAGADITLVYPVPRHAAPEGFTGDIEQFYGIPVPLQLRLLRVPFAKGRNPLQRIVRSVPFLTYLGRRARPGRPPFICFTRSFQLARLATRIRRAWGRGSACRAVIIEVHTTPPARGWSLLETIDAAVVISDALREHILQRLPALHDRVWVERSGFDPMAMDHRTDRDAARARLGLEHGGGPLVVYAGRVFRGKGVDVLIDAAEHIAGHVLIVGNVLEPDYVARAPSNVTFTGFVAPSDVPDHLAAADVLVMPTTEALHYAGYTSPLKLFEYMAARRPVVASDLPVLREVLRDGENALVYPQRDPIALAEAVQRLWADGALAERLAGQAWQDVQQYSWQARAQRILRHADALAST